MDQTDREILMVIANDMKWIKEWAIHHEAEDRSDKKLIDKDIKNLSGRFNWLVVCVVLSISLLGISLWMKP